MVADHLLREPDKTPDLILCQEVVFNRSEADPSTAHVLARDLKFDCRGTKRTSDSEGVAIISRFPIVRSQKWLDGVSLTNFGYAGHFARDLFEAEISVPDFEQPVHVFVAHLKAFSDADSAAKRAAEASAVSNFFPSRATIASLHNQERAGF